MTPRPIALSAILVVATIAAGLALRLIHLGLPAPLVKYGGSVLWAMMVYWIVSAIRRRWPVPRSALAAAVVATAVECFKLCHTPALDALRRTLPGALLLGRVFSVWDLFAYALAIALAALIDRAIRARLSPGAAPHA